MLLRILILLMMLGALPAGCSAGRTQTNGDAVQAFEITSIPRTGTLPGLAPSPFPYRSPGDAGIPAETLREIADMTLRLIAEDRIVGAEIMVIKDRAIVLHESMGWRDRELGLPMRRGSFYRIRSMTKPYTGTAAMLLIDEGRLQLGSRVSAFLPSWDNDRCRSITVVQLLTHQSGFVQGETPAPASTYGSLQELVDACGEQGPEQTPGEQFSYSDVNSYTLGALVTTISGMPVERFIEQRILAPLMLRETHVGYSPDAPWAGRMIPTYERNDNEEWAQYWTPDEASVFPYFRASGGLITTTFDGARWLAAWMDTVTASRRDPAVLTPELARLAVQKHGTDEFGDYGFHWEVFSERPLIFGHAGSDGTITAGSPERDVMVFYYTQSRRSGTVFPWLNEVIALGVFGPVEDSTTDNN